MAFSAVCDASIAHLGLEVVRTPGRSPLANALCERLIGTLRRECLEWLIPLTEEHLRKTLRSWSAYYNRLRPRSSLGPGLPSPPLNLPVPRGTSAPSLRSARPHCRALRPQRTSPRVHAWPVPLDGDRVFADDSRWLVPDRSVAGRSGLRSGPLLTLYFAVAETRPLDCAGLCCTSDAGECGFPCSSVALTGAAGGSAMAAISPRATSTRLPSSRKFLRAGS
jgi:hypothetical protein